jgi:hypothetical protein
MKSHTWRAKRASLSGSTLVQPSGRQQLWIVHGGLEQVAHHAPGPIHDLHDAGVAIDRMRQELLQDAVVLAHLGGEADQRLARQAQYASALAGAWLARRWRDSPSTSCTMREITRRTVSWISRGRARSGQLRSTSLNASPASGTSPRSITSNESGAQAVVDVMGVVGDVVGNGGDLGLEHRAKVAR